MLSAQRHAAGAWPCSLFWVQALNYQPVPCAVDGAARTGSNWTLPHWPRRCLPLERRVEIVEAEVAELVGWGRARSNSARPPRSELLPGCDAPLGCQLLHPGGGGGRMGWWRCHHDELGHACPGKFG